MAPRCGAPSRVLVAEFEGDESLRQDATDSLSAGLAAIGFQVLAPRRPLPLSPRRKPEPVDWVFVGEVRRKADGSLDLKVDVHSLRERHRVWAITDTRPDEAIRETEDLVGRTVATALEYFEFDMLRCKESEDP